MCGIAGVIYKKRSEKFKPQIKNMLNLIKHRGPDDEGLYIDDANAALAMKRLSIIDLETGHQPICNEDRSVWIVLNGEIYNYKELREDLIKNGHRFTTKSDTETIIHLYEDKGINCLKDLRGMFAFAIWDSNKEQLFIARDRIGQKPLIYAEVDGKFYFSSEIKALLQVPGITKEIDCEALHYYFTYICIPPPLTVFKKIRKLPPANYMIVDKKKFIVNEYWNCDYSSISITKSKKPGIHSQRHNNLGACHLNFWRCNTESGQSWRTLCMDAR